MAESSPAHKLIERVKAKAETPESPRLQKLFRRVEEREALFLEAYDLLGTLPWASEALVGGLERFELLRLKVFLETHKLQGIQLNGPEAYKVLTLNALREQEKLSRRILNRDKKKLEEELGVMVRFGKTSLGVSGYKKGYPITLVLQNGLKTFTVYDEGKGDMLTFHDPKTLGDIDYKLKEMIFAIDGSAGALQKLWGRWKAEEREKERLENLESFGDTGGAFA